MPLPINTIHLLSWFSGIRLSGELPIHDTDPDPGLFGPQSITWRLHHEQWLILGGARAFLMQAAHPKVAQGALDFSAFASDPFGRVYRTISAMSVLLMGTTHEVNTMAHHINRLHLTVQGAVQETIGPYTEGEQYSAMEPGALLWVHISFVDSMITAYQTFVGPLSPEERERYWQESCRYARRLGLTDAVLPASYEHVQTYIKDALKSGEVIVGKQASEVAQTILYPPIAWYRRPLWSIIRCITAGQLPSVLRQEYHLRWHWGNRVAFGSLSSFCRVLRFLLPATLGHSDLVDFAEQRVQGKISLKESSHTV
jgi:uncharacterized protein (DUF2236 family)